MIVCIYLFKAVQDNLLKEELANNMFSCVSEPLLVIYTVESKILGWLG